ncbi:hypothetical protein MTsPCn5_09220 [Croceitalea sp. MTPC5]|nr:hypothetical protein MTsPCn5_09220 [Croceitalea sp. MTPC5]
MMYMWIIILAVMVLGIVLLASKNGIKILKRENPEETMNRRYANG